MSEPKLPVPEWLLDNDKLETYWTFNFIISLKDMTRIFSGINLLMYIFIFTSFSELVFGTNLKGAIILAITGISAIGLTIKGIFKLRSYDLTLKRYYYIMKSLPRRRKIIFFAMVILSLLFLTTFQYNSPPSTFIEFMYSPIPMGILFLIILTIYPFSVIRNSYIKREKEMLQSKDDKSDTFNGDNSGGTTSHVNNSHSHSIITMIGEQKNNPLALNHKELEALEEHDAVEKYFEHYSPDQSEPEVDHQYGYSQG